MPNFTEMLLSEYLVGKRLATKMVGKSLEILVPRKYNLSLMTKSLLSVLQFHVSESATLLTVIVRGVNFRNFDFLLAISIH